MRRKENKLVKIFDKGHKKHTSLKSSILKEALSSWFFKKYKKGIRSLFSFQKKRYHANRTQKAYNKPYFFKIPYFIITKLVSNKKTIKWRRKHKIHLFIKFCMNYSVCKDQPTLCNDKNNQMA